MIVVHHITEREFRDDAQRQGSTEYVWMVHLNSILLSLLDMELSRKLTNLLTAVNYK